MTRRVLVPLLLALSLALVPTPRVHASGAPSKESVAALGAVLLLVPQVPALGSTAYYLATGPRPAPWGWSVYDLLTGGVTVWAGWLYARNDFWGYAVPCFALGALEMGYATWSLATRGREPPSRGGSAPPRLILAPGGLLLAGSF